METTFVGTMTGANVPKVIRWTYATETDRTNATGFTTDDLDKFAYVQSTNAIYILTAVTPTWHSVGGSTAGLLQASNNLSDVASASTSRTNLGLGTAAVANTTDFDAAGAAAAAQSAAVASSLQKSSNLSDLANASTARTNLGLGTAAVQNTSAFDAAGTASAAVAAIPSNAAAGTPSLRSLGTTSTTACAGNDSRLSDARTPTGAASGDLGGNFPDPTVSQMSESGHTRVIAPPANTNDLVTLEIYSGNPNRGYVKVVNIDGKGGIDSTVNANDSVHRAGQMFTIDGYNVNNGSDARLYKNALTVKNTYIIQFTNSDASGTVDTGIARNAAGVLEINNGTSGGAAVLKLNGYATAETISSPTEGMIIYNTTLHKLMVYNGITWETITSV